MLNRRQILRTPSQLYHIKPHQTQPENESDGLAAQIVGPEFVVRSKDSPKKISLIKKKRNKENGFKKVTVVKLSGQRIEITCSPSKTCISHLFEAMCKEEESCLLPFYGLAKLSHGEFYFLPPATKLFKVAPRGWRDGHENRNGILFDNFTLYFRFISYPKFYSGVPHEKTLTRHLYLQLRHDLIDGRIFLHSCPLLRLVSFSLLAEFGHDPLREEGEYFLLEHFLPQYFLQSSLQSSSVLHKRLRGLHSSLSVRGVSTESARRRFIAEARKVRHSGAHLYLVVTESGRTVWLAGNSEGIYVLQEPPSPRVMEEGTPFLWQQVKKLKHGSRRIMLHHKTQEGTHKIKFIFKQRERCAFVFYVFKLLHSHHNKRYKEASQTRNCITDVVAGTEVETVGLLPLPHRKPGNVTETPSGSVAQIVPFCSSLMREMKVEAREIEEEGGCRREKGVSEQDAVSGGRGSFQFQRTSVCRRWLEKSPCPVAPRTPSSSPCPSSRSSSSCSSSGPCGTASLRPLVSFLSVNENAKFKRHVDESFFACESLDRQDGVQGILSDSVQDPAGAFRLTQSSDTPRTSALFQDMQAGCSNYSRSTTIVTITSGTAPTTSTSTCTATYSSVTQGIGTSADSAYQSNEASALIRQTQEATTVTQMTREGSGTIRAIQLSSATSNSPRNSSFGSLQHSPTRTSLGVRMGTRVPNALLNKHKFLGIENPPGTPLKSEIGASFPVVVEPEVIPTQELNETVDESLLWRFLEAPTIVGATERRLTTVKLTRKNGSLGLVLGMGCDRALYVQGITPGGAAEQQGILKPGDRLVGVNGLCVDSLSYGQTIDALRNAPDEVSLLVSQPMRFKTQSPVSSAPSVASNPVQEAASEKKGTYVTIIPIMPEDEQTRRLAAQGRRKETPVPLPRRSLMIRSEDELRSSEEREDGGVLSCQASVDYPQKSSDHKRGRMVFEAGENLRQTKERILGTKKMMKQCASGSSSCGTRFDAPSKSDEERHFEARECGRQNCSICDMLVSESRTFRKGQINNVDSSCPVSGTSWDKDFDNKYLSMLATDLKAFKDNDFICNKMFSCNSSEFPLHPCYLSRGVLLKENEDITCCLEHQRLKLPRTGWPSSCKSSGLNLPVHHRYCHYGLLNAKGRLVNASAIESETLLKEICSEMCCKHGRNGSKFFSKISLNETNNSSVEDGKRNKAISRSSKLKYMSSNFTDSEKDRKACSHVQPIVCIHQESCGTEKAEIIQDSDTRPSSSFGYYSTEVTEGVECRDSLDSSSYFIPARIDPCPWENCNPNVPQPGRKRESEEDSFTGDGYHQRVAVSDSPPPVVGYGENSINCVPLLPRNYHKVISLKSHDPVNKESVQFNSDTAAIQGSDKTFAILQSKRKDDLAFCELHNIISLPEQIEIDKDSNEVRDSSSNCLNISCLNTEGTLTHKPSRERTLKLITEREFVSKMQKSRDPFDGDLRKELPIDYDSSGTFKLITEEEFKRSIRNKNSSICSPKLHRCQDNGGGENSETPWILNSAPLVLKRTTPFEDTGHNMLFANLSYLDTLSLSSLNGGQSFRSVSHSIPACKNWLLDSRFRERYLQALLKEGKPPDTVTISGIPPPKIVGVLEKISKENSVVETASNKECEDTTERNFCMENFPPEIEQKTVNAADDETLPLCLSFSHDSSEMQNLDKFQVCHYFNIQLNNTNNTNGSAIDEIESMTNYLNQQESYLTLSEGSSKNSHPENCNSDGGKLHFITLDMGRLEAEESTNSYNKDDSDIRIFSRNIDNNNISESSNKNEIDFPKSFNSNNKVGPRISTRREEFDLKNTPKREKFDPTNSCSKIKTEIRDLSWPKEESLRDCSDEGIGSKTFSQSLTISVKQVMYPDNVNDAEDSESSSSSSDAHVELFNQRSSPVDANAIEERVPPLHTFSDTELFLQNVKIFVRFLDFRNEFGKHMLGVCVTEVGEDVA